MIAEFYRKDVYGTEKLYPANPAAMSLASIANTKTLTDHIMHQARLGLGIEWIEVMPPKRKTIVT